MKELYSEKTELAGAFLDEIFEDEEKYKSVWAKQAKRNIAFANGDQSVTYDAAPIWVNNDPVNKQTNQRQNAYQGDEIESILRVLVSYMTRAKPTVECYADSQNEKSKNIAKVAERILESKYDIDHEYENSRISAYWGLTIGTVFSKNYWNQNKGQYVPDEDQNGQKMDGEGKPIYSKTGNNETAVLTPFSTTVDHSVTDFNEQPYIGEHNVVDVDWARETFTRDEEGYLGKADGISQDGSVTSTLEMFESLKYAIPRLGGSQHSKLKNKCLMSSWLIRPNKEMPTGRMMIKIGNQWVYDSIFVKDGNPYFMPIEEEMWHPYSMWGYEPYIGRFLYKSLVEGLIHDQVRLNEINGSILENANTLAKPNLLAIGGQLKKGVINGKGAKIYTFEPHPSGFVPITINGTPLPAQFFKEKQDIIDHMVRKAGTNFIMQGQPPTGVSAGSALQMLLDNATSQHSDMMIAWEKFHENRFEKKLRIIHKFSRYPDKNLEKYLRIFNKDALDQEIKDFIGVEDLSDGISVKIEYGSMIPKSETAKKSTYETLGKEGLLGDIGNDPKLRDQMLERLGEKPFDSEENTEIKKAKWENDRIKHGLPVEVSPYDAGQIHLPIHIGDMQDPKFLETATDEQKISLDNHIKAHQQVEDDKQQQAAQQQDVQMNKQMEMESNLQNQKEENITKREIAKKVLDVHGKTIQNSLNLKKNGRALPEM